MVNYTVWIFDQNNVLTDQSDSNILEVYVIVCYYLNTIHFFLSSSIKSVNSCETNPLRNTGAR